MVPYVREKKPLVLLVVVLFSLLVLMSSQVTSGGSTLLESVLFRMGAPVVRVFSGCLGYVAAGWENYVDLRGVRRENRRLARRIQAMELERSILEEVRRENSRLRELIDLQRRLDHPSLLAKVIANQAQGPQRVILVNRGSVDGVPMDAPVVTETGIVGRVINRGPRASKVQLITDAGSAVAVRIVRTRLQGILAGRGGETLRLRYIPQLEDVRPGDQLVTSGLDRIFADGYPVGVVLGVGSGAGPMKEIEVAPAVTFSRLEEVFILRDRGPGEETAAGSGR